jgi:cytochrome c oxidase cbb3-type subunit 3
MIRTAALVISVLATLSVLTGCERERRQFRQPTASVAAGDTGVQESPLHPGGQAPLKPGETESPAGNGPGPFENNAYAVSEGQKLYEQFNCVGCHAHGGGGIGPPLMDANWIYGGQPRNIHQSIVEGRPDGMPSFRGRIPDYQVWEIVAYVRSLSGQLPPTVAPARSDQMNVKKPEQVTPGQKPQQR